MFQILKVISFTSKNQLFLIMGITILCCFFSLKENVRAADKTILRNGNSLIKIKELNDKYKATYGTFNHPYSFSEDGIIDIFSNIFFQEKGIFSHGKTERVFSDADLTYTLSPLLVEGFAQLRPTQYLLVYNSLPRTYLKNKHNYFCLFVVGQDLYVVFGRIHQELSHPYKDEENLIKMGIEFENPMDFKSGPLWKLIPVSGQSLHPDRENILIIPLSIKAEEFVVAEEEKKVEPKKILQKEQDTREVSSDLTIKNNIPVDVTAGDETKQKEAQWHLLKEQLRFLKSLLEEGLISNENYEKKKNELLDKCF